MGLSRDPLKAQTRPGLGDPVKGGTEEVLTHREKTAGLTEATHSTHHLLRGALDTRQDTSREMPRRPRSPARAKDGSLSVSPRIQRSVNRGPWAKSSPLPIPASLRGTQACKASMPHLHGKGLWTWMEDRASVSYLGPLD